MALNQGRRRCVVIAESDQGTMQTVLRSDPAQLRQRLYFSDTVGHGLQWRLGIEDVGGHHRPHKVFQGLETENLEHALLLLRIRAEMPLHKGRQPALLNGFCRGDAALFQKGHGL